MKQICLFSFLLLFIGCQTTETNSTNTESLNTNRPEIKENQPYTYAESNPNASKVSKTEENFTSNSPSEQTTGSSSTKKAYQKPKLGDLQQDTSLNDEATGLHKDFNYEDQLLIAASLSTTVATETMSKLRTSYDTEIYLVCNKKEAKFQIVTTENLVIKAWKLPRGVNFHQPQERKLLKYAKEFSINPETQRKQLEKEWIEYEDFTLPNGEENLPYAFLLVTDNDRKCLVDINKVTGDPHVMVLN